MWTRCHQTTAGRALLLVLVTMAAGWTANLFRVSPLPLRYQPAPEVIDEEITLEEFKALVESGQGWGRRCAPPALSSRRPRAGRGLSSRENFASAYAANRTVLGNDRLRPVVIYCSGTMCEDSGRVSAALRKLGHRNVAVFRGGWTAWTAARLPEEKEPA